MPWPYFDALFIGGSTEFKMGDVAQGLVRYARARSKWVHMGRVNSFRRVRYAKAIGCNSVDGTKFSWFRDTYLMRGLEDVAGPQQQIMELTSG